MKTIGLIGGMSWESTAVYYRYMNQLVKDRLGGLHSARCQLYSFDFANIVELQEAGDWEKSATLITEAARKLEAGGSEAIVICTNTMHRFADDITRTVSIPLLHIVDVTADEIKKQSLRKVGLLGTRYTMEQPFYRERLERQGIETIVPEEKQRLRVHEIIFDELCVGKLEEDSKAEMLHIIDSLREQGAEGVILGCTEIPLLVKLEDSSVPLFDTTYLHAQAAVDYALAATAHEPLLQRVLQTGY